MAQTKEHIFLARTLGVEQVIIAVNKMDATKPAYDEARFEAVKKEVIKITKSVGYRDDMLKFLPISAFKGDNVVDKNNLSWFKGESLLQALDTMKPPSGGEDKALRWPVQDVYSITGVGTVPVGRIETGTMSPGMKLKFMPSNVIGEVKTVEMHHEMIPKAVPGDNVGVNIRGVGKKDLRRGDVGGPIDNPPTVAKSFKARIMVLNHPSVITVGYTPVFHIHTTQVACRFEALETKLDPATGQVKEENPDFLKTGDAAVVKIVPTRPMVIEPADKFPQLGRFAIRDMGQTVAAGMCIEVEKKEL